MLEGFFLINKDKNMSSHDVVGRIKKKFNFSKVGHTGTLDPLAQGLLIILVNKATKLAFLFEDLDKTYEGSMIFHKQYDTLDISGKLMDEKKEKKLSEQQITESFLFFHQKKYFQKPPIYSAIKIKGQKMYKLARKNIFIDIPARKVNIYYLNKTSALKQNQINFETKVSKGTYIRSLIRDIGIKMNTYGALKTLTRTKIGNYSLKNAKKTEETETKDLIDVKILFQNHHKIILNDYLIRLIKNGVCLDQRQILTDQPFVVLDQYRNWVAYYKPIAKNKYSLVYLFNNQSENK